MTKPGTIEYYDYNLLLLHNVVTFHYVRRPHVSIDPKIRSTLHAL